MLFILLIILGIFTLFCGLNFRAIRVLKKSGTNSVAAIIEKIESNILVKKTLDVITGNRDIWFNRLEGRILELSEVGIELGRLYLIKLICLLFCTISLFTVRYTNVGYEKKLIIQDSSGNAPIFYSQVRPDESQYRFYNLILSRAGQSNLEKADAAARQQIVGEQVAVALDSADSQLIDQKTKWFVDKWLEIQKVKFLKPQDLFIILISLFLPDMFLILSWLVKGALYKKEIIKLEYIFELLAGIEGIKTLDIIHELEKCSKPYSRWLRQFAAIFRYDKRRGFEYLKNKNINSLSKFTDIMEIYSLSDKEVALQILEREVMERDEAIIMVADETLDFIDLIAFMSIVPLVYELARLMLNPMLDIVYKAFEFI
ncbi:MAG TPA: hypothetical protein VHP38_06630 [Ruminiclostridium sp.]|nr:hypothetical protein [Ruminiclostridium sp.]